jgi:hypothetical protein
MPPFFLAATARGRHAAAILGLALALSLLAGCDPKKVSELEEDVSTEADVRSRFGEPTAIYIEPNGDRTLEYARQPAGHANYMITIGPSGKMTSLRQVLHPANLAKVVPGLDKEQVRRMLGRPAKMQGYALKEQEVWDWRFADGPEIKVFSVTFDKAGVVIGTGTTLDPKELGHHG